LHAAAAHPVSRHEADPHPRGIVVAAESLLIVDPGGPGAHEDEPRKRDGGEREVRRASLDSDLESAIVAATFFVSVWSARASTVPSFG
jgi:hypothetical protein